MSYAMLSRPPRTRGFVASFVAMTCATTCAMAAPPRVVKAVPDNGDKNVDPATREIRVEFDQDMRRGGFSWCGGGETFPKVLGRPTFSGPRTAILRVRLKPDHDYSLSVNCRSARKFVGVNGVSARPYPISFRTGASGHTPQTGSGKSANTEAVAMLREAILKNYSYRDRTGVDWGKVIDARAKRLGAARSPEDFAEQVAQMLRRAKDIHLWLKVNGQTIPTFRRNVKPNGDFSRLSEFIPNYKKHNRMVSTGRFEDRAGYILITSWSGEDRVLLEPAFAALTDFADLPGLIIDVRFNAGGAESLAAEFAGCFMDAAKVYAKHVTVSPTSARGFTDRSERLIRPNRARPKWRGEIAVLTGPYVMSSCEAFLLMMKQVRGCKLVGATSFGASGNPKPFALPNDVTVYVPSWQAMLPDGTVFEGVGIDPDIPVKTSPNDLQKGDPVLQAALDFLK